MLLVNVETSEVAKEVKLEHPYNSASTPSCILQMESKPSILQGHLLVHDYYGTIYSSLIRMSVLVSMTNKWIKKMICPCAIELYGAINESMLFA